MSAEDVQKIKKLSSESQSAICEVAIWKQVAAILGEYHAANLHDVEGLSVAKSRKARYRSIMAKAADMLAGEALPPNFRSSPTAADAKLQQAVERLRAYASKLPAPEGE
jgi:hypothetical protein